MGVVRGRGVDARAWAFDARPPYIDSRVLWPGCGPDAGLARMSAGLLVWPGGKSRCAVPVNDHVDIFERLGRERRYVPRSVDDLDQRFVNPHHITADRASRSYVHHDPSPAFDGTLAVRGRRPRPCFPATSRGRAADRNVAGVSSTIRETLMLVGASGDAPIGRSRCEGGCGVIRSRRSSASGAGVSPFRLRFPPRGSGSAANLANWSIESQPFPRDHHCPRRFRCVGWWLETSPWARRLPP